MKILILGAFLISSFAVQAQQFVTSPEALVIIDAQEIQDMNVIESLNGDYSDPLYIEKKQNVISFQSIRSIIENATSTVDVAAAIKQSVIEVGVARDVVVNDVQYDTDAIPDSYLANLKTHLITLLTQ